MPILRGRGTVLQLVEARLEQAHLGAIFVTHVHSDPVIDLADVAMTQWIFQQVVTTGPLEIVVPRGAPERFVERMLEPFVVAETSNLTLQVQDQIPWLQSLTRALHRLRAGGRPVRGLCWYRRGDQFDWRTALTNPIGTTP